MLNTFCIYMYVHLGHFAVNSIAEYARKFKISTTFCAPSIESFCMYRTALWFCQPIFFPRIYSSPPVINMMYILKYMYVSTFEEKTWLKLFIIHVVVSIFAKKPNGRSILQGFIRSEVYEPYLFGLMHQGTNCTS